MSNISRLTDSSIQSGFDGLELYYDRQDKILYSGTKGLARWVGCDPKTIERVVVTLMLGKSSEAVTASGIKVVTLINSKETIMILESLRDGSRTAEKTKQSAKDKLSKLATIGYELTGLLSVAPDEVAKTAIRRVQTKEQLAEVKNTTVVQERYLDTYHALHDEIKDHGGVQATHQAVNKYNTETLKKKPVGYRDHWEEKEKNVMIVIQQTQTSRIQKHNPSGHDEIVQNCEFVADLLQDAVLKALA